jgi:hypothetical protein
MYTTLTPGKSLLYSHLHEFLISQIIVLFGPFTQDTKQGPCLPYSKRYEVFIKINLGKGKAGLQEKII